MLRRNPNSRANRWEVSLFTPTEIHDGPAPVDRKLDANTGKSLIRYINNIMTAKKLNQQKAGPVSPASEEIKADSIGLPNLKGTVKATLETIRRIQRQTAKALSLVGTASITGMGIAGLLLAPFPVPTTFSQAQGTDDPALPAPPVPVPNKLYVDGFPNLDAESNFNMSVRFTNPQWTWPCYYWTGIHSGHSWRTTHNYVNFRNNTFYYPGRYDYWICKIVMEGDGVHYSASSDD